MRLLDAARRELIGCRMGGLIVWSLADKDRAVGFYRHLGWSSTGTLDAHHDEVLEYFPHEHPPIAPPTAELAGSLES